ncbi:MAG: NUDIX domain-containing protein [Syntrophobacteraceae bacterium]|jgi:hypothetical protein
MKRYVVGFAFTPERKYVLLVEKTHPAWQAGKWNGIGGHIEEGETPLQAMNREAAEETFCAEDFAWKHFATLCGSDFECFIFAGKLPEIPPNFNDVHERLNCWKLPLGNLARLANLDFLIEGALVMDSFNHMTITYGVNGDTGQTK